MNILNEYQNLANNNEIVLIMLHKNKAAHAVVSKKEFQSLDDLKLTTCNCLIQAIDNLQSK